ncbi:MAG: glycosyltransferase family 39 protein [Thermoflexales bacterium]|nr:glycosyltransferase family 39 protein [Thermoflexales bacterium]
MKPNPTARPRLAYGIRIARLIGLLAAAVLALVSYNEKNLGGLALAALLALVSYFRAGDLSAATPTVPLKQTLLDVRALLVRSPARTLGGLALVLAIVSAALAVPLKLSWVPAAIWVLSMAVLIAAARWHDKALPKTRLVDRLRAVGKDRALMIEIALVAAISLAALALRVWNLHDFPAFMHGDEAESAWRGIRILLGDDPIAPFVTSPDWYNLPTLFHYVEAVSLALFGRDEAGVRVLAGITGALSIPLLYLICRLLWGRIAGFAAAILATVGHSHLHYSRIDVFIYPSTAMVLMMLLIVLVYRNKRSIMTFVMMGLLIGLSQYLYSSARLLIAEGGLMLLVLILMRRIELKHALVVLLAATVAAAPLILWYAMNPVTFGGRTDEVFIFSQPALRHTLGPDYQLPRDLEKLIGIQLKGVGGYLLNKGDGGGKYTIEFPAFDLITVATLWLGTVLAVTRIRRFGEFTALSWFVSGFMIGGLLTIDAPTGNRLIAATPSIYLLCGLFFQYAATGLASAFTARNPNYRSAATTVIGAILLIGAAAYATPWNLDTYFVKFTKVADPVTPLLTGRELAPLDRSEWRTYVMGLPEMYANYAPVKFLAWKARPEDLLTADDLKPATDGRKTIVVALARNFPELDKIKLRYPGGEEREIYDQRGRLLLKSYKLP